MKTLDEVIKGFECCKEVGCGECPYKILFDDDSHVPCDQFEKDDDALQWLKGYKAHIELEKLRDKLDKLRDKYGGTSQKLRNTSQITCPKCHSEFVILPEANNPLTWNELKQMEGKPVWVESHGNITEFTGWAIVRNALEDRVHFIFSHYDGEFLTYEMALPDVTFGKEWKVYRKERS